MQRFKKVLAGVAGLAALAFGGAQIAGATSGGSDGNETADGGDQVVAGSAASQAKAAAVKAAGGGQARSVQTENDGDGETADDPAGSDNEGPNGDGDGETADDHGADNHSDDQADGPDAALSGSTAQQAKAAAVKAVGGGVAHDAHVETEGKAAYEVKVDYQGKTLEVQLDKTFTVVSKQIDEND